MPVVVGQPKRLAGAQAAFDTQRRVRGERTMSACTAGRCALTAASARRARRRHLATAAAVANRRSRDEGIGLKAYDRAKWRSSCLIKFRVWNGKEWRGGIRARRRVLVTRMRNGHRRKAHNESRQKYDSLDGVQEPHFSLRVTLH